MSNIAFPRAISSVDNCTFVAVAAAIVNRIAANPYDVQGALVVNTGVPVSHNHGIPLTAADEVCIVDKAAAVAPLYYNEGLQHDSSGAIVTVDVAAAVAPLSYSSGLVFDVSGALVTSTTP